MPVDVRFCPAIDSNSDEYMNSVRNDILKAIKENRYRSKLQIVIDNRVRKVRFSIGYYMLSIAIRIIGAANYARVRKYGRNDLNLNISITHMENE